MVKLTSFDLVIIFLYLGCPAIIFSTPSSLPVGFTSRQYSQTFTVVESGSYTYENATALPRGLTLSSDGLLSGIPAEVGNYSFTIVAYDGSLCSANGSYTLEIENNGMFTGIMNLCSKKWGNV
jgi:large repetitive protein